MLLRLRLAADPYIHRIWYRFDPLRTDVLTIIPLALMHHYGPLLFAVAPQAIKMITESDYRKFSPLAKMPVLHRRYRACRNTRCRRFPGNDYRGFNEAEGSWSTDVKDKDCPTPLQNAKEPTKQIAIAENPLYDPQQCEHLSAAYRPGPESKGVDFAKTFACCAPKNL